VVCLSSLALRAPMPTTTPSLSVARFSTLWDNEESGKAWDRSVVDCKFEVLIVSQFTLHAIMKGNKPDFHLAMKADQSKLFYDKFLGRVRSAYQQIKVQEGEFGAMMTVDLANDGPVSIWLDSRTKQ